MRCSSSIYFLISKQFVRSSLVGWVLDLEFCSSSCHPLDDLIDALTNMPKSLRLSDPYHPWDERYIYLLVYHKTSTIHVGKYTVRPMDGMVWEMEDEQTPFKLIRLMVSSF